MLITVTDWHTHGREVFACCSVCRAWQTMDASAPDRDGCVFLGCCNVTVRLDGWERLPAPAPR